MHGFQLQCANMRYMLSLAGDSCGRPPRRRKKEMVKINFPGRVVDPPVACNSQLFKTFSATKQAYPCTYRSARIRSAGESGLCHISIESQVTGV